jgi:murein L,D-transpeptidase YcbB/YkuD
MRKIVYGIAAAVIFCSCQQVAGWFGSGSETDSTGQTLNSESANRAKVLRDESITQENAYSDLFLDSAALENYIAKEKIDANKADRMREFYLVRNSQFAWFTSAGPTEQARGLWGLYASEEKKSKNEPAVRIEKRMDSLLNNSTLAPVGSDVVANDTTASKKAVTSAGKRTGVAKKSSNSDSATKKTDTAIAMVDTLSTRQQPIFVAGDTTLMQTELALTAQYVTLALENKAPVTIENFYWLIPRKKMDAMQLADSLLNKEQNAALWQNNTQYQALKTSLQPYYKAAKEGNWPQISSLAGLRKGAKSPAVVQLKKRLAATGDYPANDSTNVYNDSLMMAVKTVQQQFGLAPTGQVNDSLLRELNVPATERVQQILVNMNRSLWLPPVKDSSYIMVNIPSQELVIHGDTASQLRMPVIVGKEGAGTVAFADQITSVVFSPYWNLPQSIVDNEIKPAMQKDKDYLKKKNMEIVKQEGDYMQIRQLPGKDNSLGQVKFLFPNSLDIYLHDTPNKGLFAQQNRALSHGCIRVAKPDSLAQFILSSQPEWTPEKIREAMNSGKEQTVSVKKPVPVAITYYTAWSQNGKLHFRHDLYGYDKQTAAQMFTNITPSAASPA